ncbi:MAG TPA: CHRD domain-containing protein [Candidatus Eisenbacteria bacterium]|nr:CHRD domain-containing protein [Candidatus Eisenbacteria bacterium]
MAFPRLRPLLACAALAFAAPALAASGTQQFIAVLNGGQVVPPSSSRAFGVGYLTYDKALRRLCYTITYSTLDGLETDAHLHGGEPGKTDAVFYDLTPLGGPKLGCVGPLKTKEVKLLMHGDTYINIHTVPWAAGEIRGQVLPMRTGR